MVQVFQGPGFSGSGSRFLKEPLGTRLIEIK